MANRTFNDAQALEKEVKTLFAKVTIGASGAPTLTKGLGVASITRTSAGLYELTLQDAYPAFMGMDIVQMLPALQDLTFQMNTETVLTTKKITFTCKAAAVATDPTSTSVLFITLHLKNTSVVY